MKRSTNAPVISAGVMMANIIWNMTNSRVGMPVSSYISFTSIPESPRAPRPPMKLFPSANERLYAHSTHTTLTTAMATKLYMMVLTVFLALTSPP